VVSDRRALIDELYRRFNARNMDIFDLCHEELEWFWPDETPGASDFHGRDEVLRGLHLWAESWEELTMDPEEVFVEADYALVMARYRLRGAGSGVNIEQPLAHLFQFEDGLVRRWWIFGDAAKARRRFVAGDRPG
jgi:ketosteroid isomerase-like protein